MREGGNAIDAAVAADAVLCVVYPHMTSVAGDLTAIVWPTDATSPVGLIGAGRSGELATIEAVRSRGHAAMPARGVLTVTVPGTVEAWGRLLERFGTLGFGAVLEPAAALAQDGYLITPQLARALMAAASRLGQEPVAYALYPPMEAGMLLRNPDLASALREIGHGGINAFYRGAIAEAIAAAVVRRDGFLTRQDLASHRSQWVDPISFAYRDLTVYELPPPTQGLAAAAMLVRLEAGMPFRQARDASYALRDRYITDPDFAVTPAELFLDPRHVPAGRGSAREGRPWAAFGSMGADLQPQLQAQLLINLVDLNLNPAEAAARPRMAILPDGATIAMEADYPDAARTARSDPHVRLMPPKHPSFGHAQALVIDGPGQWRAGADPRSDGSVEYVR